MYEVSNGYVKYITTYNYSSLLIATLIVADAAELTFIYLWATWDGDPFSWVLIQFAQSDQNILCSSVSVRGQ